ncbi:L-xylulose 5-phosphate 3-epimerase [Mesocricetibacter intestinalis]|uniref:L-ribulose-5-phosphate 3-epimerase n=1 Tax=Mesocricetibacter intestinalis TaxID=1521930 RepID=A0A4R6VF52_9PAST|nr:L-ribulose-5-phosphate 3-epimerase [Mesocricetibacter intestinalis]TDQ59371.1 L-xylulose 5-phosphate 3-epimerase [Mesocricetibacter intestinalis]
MRKHKLGIYEKALPKNIHWCDRLSAAKVCGFDFVEMSIDETDERLARLDWTKAQRIELVRHILDSGITIPSMCLSAHRRFPFGSRDSAIREKAREIMQKALCLAVDLGIRTIQLAGYDVYYEPRDKRTEQNFQAGLEWAVELAAAHQVTLSMEIMDTEFMSSISRWKKWDSLIRSPWFTLYPDLGNLSAWNDNVAEQLRLGIDKISAIHLKDTYKVGPHYGGQFRDVPFGKGCVNFVECFKILAQLNYRGAFLIEMWTEKADEPISEIIHARRWIEQKMKEGGLQC